MKKYLLLVIVAMGLMSKISYSQTEYVPSKDNLEAREWFEKAKFGMFIHWGVYSILGDGEWVMTNQNIKVDRYELLPTFFNPLQFDAKSVVKLAKDAGMNYITITTKHHDGFAMYDSQVSDYSIVKATPFKRDVFRELEQECKKEGIKLFAYYSQLDWHHPDYYPRGRTGNGTGRKDQGDWKKYLEYQNTQIKELAENYDIFGFWFDGFWDVLREKGRTPETRIEGEQRWAIEDTYEMIHKIKPQLLIGNNHHLAPFKGEDFQMFEKDLPGKSTTSFGNAAVSRLPLETCETINHSWGFNLSDESHKSAKELIHYLVNAAGRNGNFLLNVGPMPNGKIQDNHVMRLKEIGAWLQLFGETIYGTKGEKYLKEGDYVSTRKGNKIYLHVLNEKLSNVVIKGFTNRVKKINRYDTKKGIQYKLRKDVLSINLPIEVDKNHVRIIEITLK